MGSNSVDFNGKFQFSCNNISNSGSSSNYDTEANHMKDTSRSLFLAKWIERWKQNHVGKMYRIYTHGFMKNARGLKILIDTVYGKVKNQDITSTPTYKTLYNAGYTRLCELMVKYYTTKDLFALDSGEVRTFHEWDSGREPLFLRKYQLTTYSMYIDENAVNSALNSLKSAMLAYNESIDSEKYLFGTQSVTVLENVENKYNKHFIIPEGSTTLFFNIEYTLTLRSYSIILDDKDTGNVDIIFANYINGALARFCTKLGISRNSSGLPSATDIRISIDKYYTISSRVKEDEYNGMLTDSGAIPDMEYIYTLKNDISFTTIAKQMLYKDNKFISDTSFEQNDKTYYLYDKGNTRTDDINSDIILFTKCFISQGEELSKYTTPTFYNRNHSMLYELDKISSSYSNNKLKTKNNSVLFDHTYDSEEGRIHLIKSGNLFDIKTVQYHATGSNVMIEYLVSDINGSIVMPSNFSSIRDVEQSNLMYNLVLPVFAKNLDNPDEEYIPYEEFKKLNITPIDENGENKLNEFLNTNKFLFRDFELVPSFFIYPGSFSIDMISFPYQYICAENTFYVQNADTSLFEPHKKTFLFPIYELTYLADHDGNNTLSSTKIIENLNRDNIDISSIFNTYDADLHFSEFLRKFRAIKPIITESVYSPYTKEKDKSKWLPIIQLLKPLRILGNGQSVICIGATSYPFKFKPQEYFGVFPNNNTAWFINWQENLKWKADGVWLCNWEAYRTNTVTNNKNEKITYTANTVIYCPLYPKKEDIPTGRDIYITFDTFLQGLKLVSAKLTNGESYPLNIGFTGSSYYYKLKPNTSHIIFEYKYNSADESILTQREPTAKEILTMQGNAGQGVILVYSQVPDSFYLSGLSHQIILHNTGTGYASYMCINNSFSRTFNDLRNQYSSHDITEWSYYAETYPTNKANILQKSYLMSYGHSIINHFTGLDEIPSTIQCTASERADLQKLTAYHIKREILEKAIERCLKKIDFDLYKYAMKFGEKTTDISNILNFIGINNKNDSAVYKIYNEKGVEEEVVRPLNFSIVPRTYSFKEYSLDYVGNASNPQINSSSPSNPYEWVNNWGGANGDAHVTRSYLSRLMVTGETTDPTLPAINLAFGINLWGKTKTASNPSSKNFIVKNSWLTDGEKYYLFEYFCLLLETNPTNANFRSNLLMDDYTTYSVNNLDVSYTFTRTCWCANIIQYLFIKSITFSKIGGYNTQRGKHKKEDSNVFSNPYTMPSENYKLYIRGNWSIEIIEVKTGFRIQVEFDPKNFVNKTHARLVLSQAKGKDSDGRWVDLTCSASDNNVEENKRQLLNTAENYNQGIFFPLNYGIFKKAPPIYKYQILDRGVKFFTFSIGLGTNTNPSIWEKIGYTFLAVVLVVTSVVLTVLTVGAAAPTVLGVMAIIGTVLGTIASTLGAIVILGSTWGFLDETQLKILSSIATWVGAVGGVFGGIGALGGLTSTLSTVTAVIGLCSSIVDFGLKIRNTYLEIQFEKEKEELENEQKAFKQALDIRLNLFDEANSFLTESSAMIPTDTLAIFGIQRLTSGQVQAPDDFFDKTKNIDSKISYYKQFQFNTIEYFVSMTLSLY